MFRGASTNLGEVKADISIPVEKPGCSGEKGEHRVRPYINSSSM